MSGPEVAPEGGIDIDSQEEQDLQRARRRRGLIAVIVLLILLLCTCATVSQVWLTGDIERARFVARNVECLQCHASLIPDFSKPSVHEPFAQQKCTKCHIPHGQKVTVSTTVSSGEVLKRFQVLAHWLPFKWWLAITGSDPTTVRSSSASETPGGVADGDIQVRKSGLVMPQAELCWSCHEEMRDLLDEDFTHQPFEAGRCTGCHSPHASEFESRIAVEPTTLCFICHPLGEQLQRMQTHPPAKEGRCVECHNPHASAYRGIIVSSQRSLCMSCHPSVAAKENLAVQHAPFLNGDCTGCHQPHGSRYEPLLNAIRPDLCYECHPETESDFRRPSHHPVGGTFTCASCHDPHAAPFLNLVAATGNGFCYQCHTSVRKRYDASAHAETRCDSCHTAHGSNSVPLLVQRNPPLCFRCHARKGYDERTHAVLYKNHPVRGAHYDVNAEAPLTCTSSCHNPHGTELNRMLRYFDYHRDGTCLMCHAVTKGSRIGIDY